MDNLLMDMVYLGCGVIFGLILRKLRMVFRKREWVGLTDEEIRKTVDEYFEFDGGDVWGSYRAIEAKLKEKNAL
jgi:hypothetical protein